jgi:hypothetical protein
MARLHAITANQWRPTERIAGKNILGFGKTVRGPRVPGQCGFRGGASVLLGQWPLIATNGICLVLAAFILVMKILPASGKRAVVDTLDPSADGS